MNLTEEQKAERSKKIALAMTERVLSDDTKKKISIAVKGKNNGMFGRTSSNHPNSKKIKAIFPDGKEIVLGSGVEMIKYMSAEYGLSESLVCKLIGKGPYNPRKSKFSHLRGLVIEYVGSID